MLRPPVRLPGGGVYVTTIVVVVLLSFQISNEVLAVLGGTAAVAMGFAMKDLVASVVAGVMIMMDRPFQVGDRVSFGGQYGDITNIGLRSVRMQTLDDNTVTIPNNKFLTDITSCGNYGALDMQVVMDFHIGVDQDVHAAQRIVQEAGVSSRYVYLPNRLSSWFRRRSLTTTSLCACGSRRMCWIPNTRRHL